MIVLNFKTYPEVTLGNNAVKLAQIAQEVFEQYQVPIILCLQATDIYKVKQHCHLPLFAQHIDPINPGQNTGFISALSVKENGASGVMINHSEHRIGDENIQKTLAICKQNQLQTLVCVENAEEAVKINEWQPDMIALEDPVLIGGEVSIVKNEAGKQKVEEFVAKNLSAKTLVGAGVKSKDDIIVSLKIGAAGVLLASGFTKAADPKAFLEDLSQGFK
ncbi:triose-phosphate isomerase [Candidatus Beckwithbacteria bacterium]|nr:triose-phosphate isomerase [Candidatus Beckwithbacteria bacterium]